MLTFTMGTLFGHSGEMISTNLIAHKSLAREAVTVRETAAKHGFDDVVMAFAEFECRQLSADAGDAALTSEMSTQDYLLLKTRADEAFRAGLHSAAAACYSSLIDVLTQRGEYEPKQLAILYSNRSACSVALSRPHHALADARRSVELAPEWAKAHSRLGTALLLFDHRVRLAASAFADAAALDPTYGERALLVAEQANQQKLDHSRSAIQRILEGLSPVVLRRFQEGLQQDASKVIINAAWLGLSSTDDPPQGSQARTLLLAHASSMQAIQHLLSDVGRVRINSQKELDELNEEGKIESSQEYNAIQTTLRQGGLVELLLEVSGLCRSELVQERLSNAFIVDPRAMEFMPDFILGDRTRNEIVQKLSALFAPFPQMYVDLKILPSTRYRHCLEASGGARSLLLHFANLYQRHSDLNIQARMERVPIENKQGRSLSAAVYREQILQAFIFLVRTEVMLIGSTLSVGDSTDLRTRQTHCRTALELITTGQEVMPAELWQHTSVNQPTFIRGLRGRLLDMLLLEPRRDAEMRLEMKQHAEAILASIDAGERRPGGVDIAMKFHVCIQFVRHAAYLL